MSSTSSPPPPSSPSLPEPSTWAWARSDAEHAAARAKAKKEKEEENSAPALSASASASASTSASASDMSATSNFGSMSMDQLRASGYAGGPIMSKSEAAGVRFGLHRPSFKAKTNVTVWKVYVGLDIIICAQYDYPLRLKLEGTHLQHFQHIMNMVPAVFVQLQGSGTDQEQEHEPLYIRLAAEEKQRLVAAKAWVDSLIAHVRKDFEAYYQTYMQHAFETGHIFQQAILTHKGHHPIIDLLQQKVNPQHSLAHIENVIKPMTNMVGDDQPYDPLTHDVFDE